MNEVIPVTVGEVEQVIFEYVKEFWNNNLEPVTSIDDRYPGRLEATLGQVFQEVYGTPLYPDIFSKAAALFYFMNKNHPFINGNKRIAVMTLLYFLYKNNYWLYLTDDDFGMYDIALFVSNSRAKDKDKIMAITQALFRKAIRLEVEK